MNKNVVVLATRREASERFRAQPERLAVDHPELIGGDSGAADWEMILAKTTADAAQVVSFRLDAELLERLDGLAAKMQAAAPWAKGIGRTDAVRKLLIEGLDREGVTSSLAAVSQRTPGGQTKTTTTKQRPK